MSKIKVDLDQLEEAEQKLGFWMRQLENLEGELDRLHRQVDPKITGRRNIEARLGQQRGKVIMMRHNIRELRDVIKLAATLYEQAERRIESMASQIPDRLRSFPNFMKEIDRNYEGHPRGEVEKIKSQISHHFESWFKPLDQNTPETEVQHYLNLLGFDIGEIDGILGVKSSSALLLFQYSQGIPITGRPDEETIDALKDKLMEGLRYDDIMNSDKIKNWKPAPPSIDTSDLKINGWLKTENLTRMPGMTKYGIYQDAYAERETAIAWAMMVFAAMEHNKQTTGNKLNINNFMLKGDDSGYRSYHMQVEAFFYEKMDANAAAKPYFNNKEAAEAWYNEEKHKIQWSADWNNIERHLTEKDGILWGHGKSNHGFGIALDMYVGHRKYSPADTKEAKWLEENGHRFGFKGYINKEKTNENGVTTYTETWHWEYKK